MNDFTKFLIRLKIYRSGLEITQQQAANHLKVSLRTYQRIEQGTAPLDIQHVYALCELLNTPYQKMVAPTIPKSSELEYHFFDAIDLSSPILKDFKDIPLDEFTKMVHYLKNILENKKASLKDLYKDKNFQKSPINLFLCNPSYTWMNKATITDFLPGSPSKVPVMKNVENLDSVIHLWEKALEEKKSWYFSSTKVRGESSRSTVQCLCYFHLYEGLPFIIGHVLQNPTT